MLGAIVVQGAENAGSPALWGTATAVTGEPMEGVAVLSACCRQHDDHVCLHRRAGTVLLSTARATVRSRDVSGVGAGGWLFERSCRNDIGRRAAVGARLHAEHYRRLHAPAVRHRMVGCAAGGHARGSPAQRGVSGHLHGMPPRLALRCRTDSISGGGGPSSI